MNLLDSFEYAREIMNMDKAMRQLEEISEKTLDIDFSKLPPHICMLYIQEAAKLTRAIKEFNEEASKLIVCAEILGREE